MQPIDEWLYPVVEAESSGQIVALNEATRRLLGEMGLTEREITRILPPDFAQLVAHCAVAQGRLVQGAGGIGPCEIVWIFQRLADPSRVRIHGLDIAPVARRERALRSGREQLMKILSSAGNGIDVVNSDYVIEYENDLLVQQFGDHRGEKCYEAFARRKEPCENCAMARALETGTVQRNENVRVGGRIYEISSSPFVDMDGQTKVLQIVRDMTDYHEMARALQESEERFRTLFTEIPEAVIVFDPATYQIVDANRVTEERYDYTRDELLQMTLLDLRPAEEVERFRAMAANIHPQGFYVREGILHRKRNGEVFPVTVYAAMRPIGGRLLVIAIVVDMTERVRAEQALRQSEEMFRVLVESSHDVFYIHDPDGVLRYISPNVEELFGVTLPPGPLRWTDLLSDNPVNRHGIELTEQAFRTGEKQPRYELELQSPDGRRFWVEITESPQIRDGRIVGLIGAAHDITARKRAEQALCESGERHRSLIEQSPVAISIVQDGRFVYMNPTGCELIGCTLEELAGREVWTVVHPDDREMIHERTFRRQLGEPLPPRYEFRVVTKNGKMLWVELAAVPSVYEGRAAVMCYMADVTDRKRAEQGLRLAEARYRELYENATDIIYTHDLDGHITSVNVVAERVFGRPREALLGRNLRDLIHADSLPIFHRAMEERLLHPNRPSQPFEIQIHDAKGELHWLEIKARLIFGHEDPVGVTGIARDITERKQLETQLRQAQKMDALGKLAGGVAHDFNNLLTGILGYAQLLAGRVGEDAEARANVTQIERAADRAARLTRQLLAFSRHQQLSSVYLDLNQVILDITQLLSRTVGEHIELTTTLAPDLPAVYADRTQLEQILLNLAVNARDAMPEGGQLTIFTRMVEFDAPFVVAHPWARRGRFVEMFVADTGVGMSAYTLERAFEPFYSTKPPDKGTGLGLAIVYGIVKQHDGLIRLESELGMGTTVHLYFPAAEHPVQKSVPEEVSAVRGGREVILLAEDEPIVRDFVTQVLTDSGYSVVTVSDGEQALEILRERPDGFNLVILDMVMPRKGGAEVWRDVCTLAPKARILLISGYAPESMDTRVGEPGGPAFLGKPFTPVDLLHKVRDLLDIGK